MDESLGFAGLSSADERELGGLRAEADLTDAYDWYEEEMSDWAQNSFAR
ncbi:MAG: hypothetical protein H0X40_00640 [Chthoniobacterales bacterium]|nr:hypothetical protein [Chthoniobacterales bacterium]